MGWSGVSLAFQEQEDLALEGRNGLLNLSSGLYKSGPSQVKIKSWISKQDSSVQGQLLGVLVLRCDDKGGGVEWKSIVIG